MIRKRSIEEITAFVDKLAEHNHVGYEPKTTTDDGTTVGQDRTGDIHVDAYPPH